MQVTIECDNCGAVVSTNHRYLAEAFMSRHEHPSPPGDQSSLVGFEEGQHVRAGEKR